MAWTGRRTGAAVVAATALASGLYAAGPGAAGAAAPAAPAAAPAGWLQVLAAAGAEPASADEVSPAVTGARTLRFTSRPVRDAFIDVGKAGEGPGDIFVFEERLTNRAGRHIGSDSVRCMAVVRTFRCDATFTIRGQGSFEVSQSFGRTPLLAVTGGTGDFRNVRGQARIVGGSGSATHFEVRLLP